MEVVIFWACALALAVTIGYKFGKWSKELEMIRLQDDNIKLSGEVHNLEKEINRANIRFVEEVSPKNSIKGREE